VASHRPKHRADGTRPLRAALRRPLFPRHRRRQWGKRVVPVALLTMLAGTGWLSAEPALSEASLGAAPRSTSATSSNSIAELIASRQGARVSRSASRVLFGAARIEAIEARANRKVHNEWARQRAAQRRQAAIREARQWGPPLASYHITATFGETSYLWSGIHTGVDLDSTTGTPVHSVGPGVVTFTGYDGSYGNKVVVRHPDGSRTWYCHLSAIDVTKGESVTHETVVGLVGATGNVTGDHLHLELHPAGQKGPVDPVAGLLAAHGIRL
jgi:murein DD-endopeptidase MepM/ murein hydrolase activator NlpD